MNLKFLIVLVYYKRPQMVLNALHSIKSLNYDNWHLHFIDDSGDDSFKDTLMTYGLDLTKVTYTPIMDSETQKMQQGGSRHGHYMNEAIKKSDSDVTVILCDDDAIVYGYFEYMDEYYQLNPDVNWSYCKLYFFDPSKEFYTESKQETSYDHPGSTYNLNHHTSPLNPAGCVDSSQITFRTNVFRNTNIAYPSPQTRGLDASIFTQIINDFGLCYPNFVYGQYKGAFADQLGNRWRDGLNEFEIRNR